MTALDLLKAARSKIAEGFCQDALAKNALGDAVETSSALACKWCTWGALVGSSPLGSLDPVVNEAARYLCQAIDHECQATTYFSMYAFVSHWNDVFGRTKSEVLTIYDAAIVLCEDDFQVAA